MQVCDTADDFDLTIALADAKHWPGSTTTRMEGYRVAMNRELLWSALLSSGALCAQGAAWIRSSGIVRPQVTEAMLATDPLRQRVVLVGLGQGTQSETWEWNGLTWSRTTPATLPPPRRGGVMGYDPRRQRVLLTGGTWSTTTLNDAWEWDGISWTMLPTIPTRLSPQPGTVVTDNVHGRLLHAGLGTVAEWINSNWTQIGTWPLPSAANYNFAAYDDARDALLIQVHGTTVLQIWIPPYRQYIYTWQLLEWTASGAQQVAQQPAGSTDATGFPLNFDPVRTRVTSLEPRAGASSTSYEWAGAWQQPSVQPIGAYGVSIAFDPVNRRLIALDPQQPGAQFEWHSASPPAVQPFGTGCAGSLGLPEFAAVPFSLPWTGDTFALRLTNVPTGALPIAVLGLSNTAWDNTPLPAPLGGSCQLLVRPDLWWTMTTTGNVATLAQTIPANASLAGLQFFAQAGALNAGGPAVLGGALSNALACTVGVR